MKNLIVMLVSALLLTGNAASAQDWTKAKLEKSHRHLEWVDVKNGERTLKCFVAYPESKKPTTAVLVIHEIFGLSDWIRLVCDELAAAGYLAIAPDLLSGKSGEDTTKFTSVDDVRKAVSGLPKEQLASDLAAIAEYVVQLPAANKTVAVTGYCWGGTQTWLAMTTIPKMRAGFVFYGTAGTNTADFNKINGPVYGFYGEKDARVTSTISETTEKMKEAKKDFFPETYKAAGHGFMRTAGAPDAERPNIQARKKAWKRMLSALRKL